MGVANTVRPVWLRALLLVGVLAALLLHFAPPGLTDGVPVLQQLFAAPPNQRPGGFSINDPLDPAMKTGYRHPFYEGYVGPGDPLFPTSDPALARFAHQQYSLELDQNDRDPAFGWASVRLPDGLAALDEAALRPIACTVFRGIVAEPHHAGYQHLLIELHGGEGPAIRFDLRRAECGA